MMRRKTGKKEKNTLKQILYKLLVQETGTDSSLGESYRDPSGQDRYGADRRRYDQRPGGRLYA